MKKRNRTSYKTSYKQKDLTMQPTNSSTSHYAKPHLSVFTIKLAILHRAEQKYISFNLKWGQLYSTTCIMWYKINCVLIKIAEKAGQ